MNILQFLLLVQATLSALKLINEKEETIVDSIRMGFPYQTKLFI
jgi:hypothetical protein